MDILYLSKIKTRYHSITVLIVNPLVSIPVIFSDCASNVNSCSRASQINLLCYERLIAVAGEHIKQQ